MANKPQFTAGEIIGALKKHQGLAALAAESLGVNVQTIYNYRDRHPSVAEAMAHLKEKRIDVVEGKLWQRINSEDTTAIIFFLKTQAKSRGYVERVEQTGADGSPMESKMSVTIEYIETDSA